MQLQIIEIYIHTDFGGILKFGVKSDTFHTIESCIHLFRINFKQKWQDCQNHMECCCCWFDKIEFIHLLFNELKLRFLVF